jgi:hypothetical protein
VTEGPSINVDEFRHRPVNEVASLLPNKEAVEATIKDLQTANVDISTVRVLHGEKGGEILDPTGAEHGFTTRIVRWLQTRGYDRNILDVTRRPWVTARRLSRCPVPQQIAAHWAG